jgi:hypothetical protein
VSGRIDAGLIFIETRKVKFASRGYGKWELALDEVVLVGEDTTDDGPIVEE